MKTMYSQAGLIRRARLEAKVLLGVAVSFACAAALAGSFVDDFNTYGLSLDTLGTLWDGDSLTNTVGLFASLNGGAGLFGGTTNGPVMGSQMMGLWDLPLPALSVTGG